MTKVVAVNEIPPAQKPKKRARVDLPSILKMYRQISESETDPEDCSPLWQMIRKQQQDDPAKFLEKLGKLEHDHKQTMQKQRDRKLAEIEAEKKAAREREESTRLSSSKETSASPADEPEPEAGELLDAIDKTLAEYSQ
jgi:hypothetical protein